MGRGHEKEQTNGTEGWGGRHQQSGAMRHREKWWATHSRAVMGPRVFRELQERDRSAHGMVVEAEGAGRSVHMGRYNMENVNELSVH